MDKQKSAASYFIKYFFILHLISEIHSQGK